MVAKESANCYAIADAAHQKSKSLFACFINRHPLKEPWNDLRFI